MKHRRNKVKREHSIIQDALSWLEELSRNSEVTDIIPGVIEVSRSPERGIVYKYETQTGCKILLKSNGSIQEAFVVTKNPRFIRQWIEKHFPTEASEKEVAEIIKTKSQQSPKEVNTVSRKNNSHINSIVKHSEKRMHKGKTKRSISKRQNSENRWMKSEGPDLPGIGQRINSKTLKALKKMQEELNQVKIQKDR